MKSVVLLAVSALFAIASAATNYCDPNLCTNPGNHVACGFQGKASKKCTGSITFDKAQKQRILDAHNKLRQKIASGQQSSFSPANRMATLKWHDELEFIARANALNCNYKHDTCLNTKEFKFVGQNLAFRSQSNGYPEVNQAIDAMIQDWYSEVKDTKQSDINRFMDTGTRDIGHFTQVRIYKKTFE
jgi:hypothetical protein